MLKLRINKYETKEDINKLYENSKNNDKLKNYVVKQLYKINKKIDMVPIKRNKLTCIILRENKSAKVLQLNRKKSSFHYAEHLYFTYPDSTYNCDNMQSIAVYLEGISTPFSHMNVEKRIETRKYMDLDNTEKEIKVSVIKGLKFDSRILDILTNRRFAEIFTKVTLDKWSLYTFFVCIAGLVLTGICIGVSYYYH